MVTGLRKEATINLNQKLLLADDIRCLFIYNNSK